MSLQAYFPKALIAFLFLSALIQLFSAPVLARDLRVCVLNDSVEPVQESLIEGLLRYASLEYAHHVGIRFSPEEKHTFPLDIFLSDKEQLKRVRETCRRSEIAVIFSAQMIPVRDWYQVTEKNSSYSDPGSYLLGLSNPLGYAILTSIPYARSTLDSAGNPKIYGTIKHELGHLFYDNHLDDENSFLYRYGNGRNGWTDETRWVIRQHCLREWQLEPSVIHLTREDLQAKDR